MHLKTQTNLEKNKQLLLSNSVLSEGTGKTSTSHLPVPVNVTVCTAVVGRNSRHMASVPRELMSPKQPCQIAREACVEEKSITIMVC